MRVLFFITLLLTNTAFASAIKNKDLLKACEDKGVAGQNFCYGFIVSASNAAQYYRNIMDAKGAYLDVCFPKDITNAEIVKTYVGWAKAHPEVMGSAAFIGVSTALSIKYSCGKKKG